MSCMIAGMTTETVISGDYPDEPLPVAVARRLRGQLAEHRMTLEDLGRVLGVSKMSAGRRVNGDTPITLADLERIDAATPITAAYLLTGHHPTVAPTPPTPPGHAANPSGGKLLRLPQCGREAERRGELVEVEDDSWVALSEGRPLPRLDSNQQPFGCRSVWSDRRLGRSATRIPLARPIGRAAA